MRTILILGDLCPAGSVESALHDESILGDMGDVIRTSDLVIFNLEAP